MRETPHLSYPLLFMASVTVVVKFFKQLPSWDITQSKSHCVPQKPTICSSFVPLWLGKRQSSYRIMSELFGQLFVFSVIVDQLLIVPSQISQMLSFSEDVGKTSLEHHAYVMNSYTLYSPQQSTSFFSEFCQETAPFARFSDATDCFQVLTNYSFQRAIKQIPLIFNSFSSRCQQGNS